jgi:hypothetical protein
MTQSLLTQILQGRRERDLVPLTRFTQLVLENPRPLFYVGVEETISGLVLASIALNSEQSPFGNVVRDCENLTTHPLLKLYTKGVLALGYLEWEARING